MDGPLTVAFRSNHHRSIALDEIYNFVFGLVTIGLDVRPLINLNDSDADAI